MTDRKLIVCNYIEGTSSVPMGAKAYILPQLGGNLPERVRVLVRSRGGRWIEKWEGVRRLGDFRFKTIPPEHPRYSDERFFRDMNDGDLDGLVWSKERVG